MSSPIPGTGLAVVTDRLWSLQLFYQLLNGHVEESSHRDGVWKNQQLTFSPVDDTPLAAITYSGGKQIRVYYLDTNYFVQEYCFTDNKWYQGEVNKLGARAVPSAGLAAAAFGVDVHGVGEKGVHIRVYYQDATTNRVEELANDGSWYKGKLEINDALGATDLAAVAYWFQDQTQIRVYYQDRGLSLREYGYNKTGWFKGAFNPGQATAHTPLAALAFSSVQLQVYYRNLKGEIVYVKNTGSWGTPIVIKDIGPGYNLAVLEWDNGNRLRLYYQLFSGALAEYCSDDGGKTWFPGKFHIAGV